MNGYRQEGFAAFDRNLHRGRRLSAARAYLHPVRHRRNLTVKTRAFVEKIVFEGTRAVGVICDGERISAGEVIVSGGAINSPQLLQLSGVGPADLLEPLGIEMVHDLPGVGANLQDHLEVYVQHACTQPVSQQPSLAMWRRPFIGAQWLFLRGGPGATNHFEAGGFIRSNDDVPYPNLMFHFLPIAVRYDGSAPAGGHGYQVHIGPMYSDARGSVRITSADPRVKPALRFNYLSTEQDRREWVEAIRRTREILSQPAWAALDGGETLARPLGGDRRGDPRLGGQGRRDRPAPVVHLQDGRGRDGPSCDPDRYACTAWRACAWWTPRPCRTSPTATSTPRS